MTRIRIIGLSYFSVSGKCICTYQILKGLMVLILIKVYFRNWFTFSSPTSAFTPVGANDCQLGINQVLVSR